MNHNNYVKMLGLPFLDQMMLRGLIFSIGSFWKSIRKTSSSFFHFEKLRKSTKMINETA